MTKNKLFTRAIRSIAIVAALLLVYGGWRAAGISVSAQSSPFTLAVRPVDAVTGATKTSFFVGETVAVVLTVTNQSAVAQTITDLESTEIPVTLTAIPNRSDRPDVRTGTRGGAGRTVQDSAGNVFWSSAPKQNVVLAPGQSLSVTINDVSRFFASKLDDGTYTLSATYNGIVQAQTSFTVFIDQAQSVPVLQQMAAGQNDLDRRWALTYLDIIQKPSISGRVVNSSGAPLGGVTLYVTGSLTSNLSTLADGRYDLMQLTSGGSYTLTPALEGYTLAPATRTFSNLTTKQVDVNFTATRVGDGVNLAVDATVTASSTLDDDYRAESVIDGSTSGVGWGMGSGGWEDGTLNAFPDWIEVNFGAAKAIDWINVYTLQDNFTNSVEPTITQTFSLYGITDFDVQYWSGSTWVIVPGGAVNGNNNVWRKFTFPTVTTTKIRVFVRNGLAGKSRITEIQAFHQNVPPTVSITGNYQGAPGTTFQFTANAADSDGTISRLDWDFGDGATATGANASHTYPTAGTFTAAVVVTDDGGETARATKTVTITALPQPPTASAGGPYNGVVGSPVVFEGRASFDPDGSITTYQWNFGDSTSGTGPTPSHTYAQTGTYSVTLVVTDNSGSTASQTAIATIATGPPAKASQTITFNAPANKTYGDAPFAVSASSSSGLSVSLAIISGPATISGSSVTITGAGTVTIRASQAGDTNYNAAANVERSFTVAKAAASITLSNLNQTYNGTPRPATATTTPAGLAGVSITYTGSATAPTNVGSYSVIASLTNDNYTGNATGTLVIAKAAATIALSNLNQTYNGSPRPATATTTPAGLSGVSITYNGSATAPINAGSYSVVAALNNQNYTATNATATLVISEGGSGPQPVTWTNTVGVTANGNSLTKTASEGWGNAGAASTQTIASGDGYVEFTATETNTYRMIGLSNGDSNQNYPDIDFAIYPAIGATLDIREGGVSRGTFGSYATGDTLRVAVEGGVVKYRKNGVLLYTSAGTPTYPLLVDTSFYSNGGTISNVMISTGSSGGESTQNVSWTNTVGVSASGNNLTRTAAGDAWNAGAVSTQMISSGDGYVEITASEANKKRAFGLTNNTSVTTYPHNVYGMHLSETGQITIHEGDGVYGVFGTYTSGDVLRVAIEGGVVKYRKNGTLLRTSTLAPTYPLRAGAALYTNGSTVNSAVLSSGGGGTSTQTASWTNSVGVAVNGNNLTKTAAEGWGNAGASSTQSIASGDGYVETTMSETNMYRMIGLSNGDSHQNYNDIDFAFYPAIGATLYIYEGGTSRGTFGTYASGDVLRIAVEGGVVKYRKNGVLLHTSAVAPSYPLLVDTAFYSPNSTINNVIISGNLSGGGGGSAQLRWVVTDHLGMPRLVFDQTGSVANVSPHDYLPFGKELFGGPPSHPGVGGRTTTMGYRDAHPKSWPRIIYDFGLLEGGRR
ncbi:MAG TPA: MBG domain-containing protein [Pyrinomonadaceae bacterium]